MDTAAMAFGFGADLIFGTMVVEGVSYLAIVTRKKDVGRVKRQTICRITCVQSQE